MLTTLRALRPVRLAALAMVALFFWVPTLTADASTPTLGLTVQPATATLQDGTVTTRVQNLSTIPATVTADVHLSLEGRTSSLMAHGWTVTVEPATLPPEGWATVTASRENPTPASDLTISILLAPAESQAGTDANALRYGLTVDAPEATTTTTLLALLEAWGWTLGAPI